MKKCIRSGNSRVFLVIMLMIIVLIMASLEAAALIIDDADVISEDTEREIGFDIREYNSRANIPLEIVIITAEESFDIDSDALVYYNQYSADLLVMYSVADNNIATVTTDYVLSDETINALLDSWAEQKEGITREGIDRFMDLVMFDVIVSLDLELELSTDAPAEETHQEDLPLQETSFAEQCSVLKDGECDENCPIDLDCECGDGWCQSHENFDLCPQDCEEKKSMICGILSDDNCDLNCPINDIDCDVTAKINFSAGIGGNKDVLTRYLMPPLLFILFFLVIITAYVIAEIIKDRAKKYARGKR